MGLILDTSIAIFAERCEQSPQALIDGLNSGNDGHGSKIIVIPFDGAALDSDLAGAVRPKKTD